MVDMDHLNFLKDVAVDDVTEVKRKEATYKGSWKKRGGIGTFMMMARKWDRLEIMMEKEKYDIFAAIENSDGDGDGTPLAEVRDLRRYLLLVEAEITARSVREQMMHVERTIPKFDRPGTPEDGGQHAQQSPLYISDGLNIDEIEDAHRRFYITMQISGDEMICIVDRRQFPKDSLLLPLLAIELNDKEHTMMQPCYQQLYQWDESNSKWVMQPEFREYWGK
jgi:hypothetical protein